MGLFQKLKEGLSRTRDSLVSKIDQLFQGGEVDDDFYDDLEAALISADLGVHTAQDVIEQLRAQAKADKLKDAESVRQALREILSGMLREHPAQPLAHPLVVLVVGVNGVGKTTSIGKMAARFQENGHRVMLAAGDTFRAAAAEQLAVWAQRAGVPLVRHEEGADPAAVVFDAISSAKAKGVDTLIVDTAGRLHNKKNLMEELKKIGRVVAREWPDAHREVLLVLDGTTGQNAMVQAKAFSQEVDITGIVLTKLDGTAKGGVVISILRELPVPVRFVGVGEGLDDLQDFSAEDFVNALL